MKILLLRVTLLISVGLSLLGFGAVQAANQPSQAHIVASVAKVSQTATTPLVPTPAKRGRTYVTEVLVQKKF